MVCRPVPMLVFMDDGTLRRARLQDYVEAVRILAALVPPGRVTTYGAIARLLRVSPRLVGRALALNPEPLVYPCHRVVSSDGSIGGYSLGGPRLKRRILEAEGVPLSGGKVRSSSIVVDVESLMEAGRPIELVGGLD